MPSPTPQQRAAIEARGDVLVMAGAGSGKTSTLVHRILDRILNDTAPVSLEDILVVTFTESAAAEMRHRLGAALESRHLEAIDDPRLAEQIAVLETAQVSTLHAFCLRLLREHFHELELDPQFSLQDETQTAVLRDEVLTAVFGRHYAPQTEPSASIQSFLEHHARDREKAARALILKLHDFLRTLPAPDTWLARQRALYESTEPQHWRQQLIEGLKSWVSIWRLHAHALASGDPENFVALESADALDRLEALGDSELPFGPARLEIVNALSKIAATADRKRFSRGQVSRWFDPLKRLVEEAGQLHALLSPAEANARDPIEEDWDWARRDVLGLIELVSEFNASFTAARRAAAVVDFADLEQLALQLLWDPCIGAPSRLARHWQQRLEMVFVDEYQDINGAQDRIIECLSRPGPDANRFFVGDVKQSIYRFRRADPGIFQRYARDWTTETHRTVLPLVENFRSHERILEFVNEVFGELIRADVGGVAYDAAARLIFGAPETRAPFCERPEGRVELILHMPPPRSGAAPERDASAEEDALPVEDLDAEEIQAGWTARRVRELHNNATLVWDPALQEHRPARWRDIVVLHPSPRPVAERWARQFLRHGIPIEARRSGFFDALEVADLVHLTRLLDNPRQDLPLLAVLRSPLVAMTVDQLALVRLAGRDVSLWDALQRLAGSASGTQGRGDTAEASAASPGVAIEWTETTRRQAALFLERYHRWRRLAREGSLAWCLEVVLAETGYEAILRAQPRAEGKLANLRKLLALSREFDQFQRHGLFRFLQYLDAQSEVGRESESAPAAVTDSVRLLSIHQSKGLEFPIVIVAGLGRLFNLQDLRGDWILDENFGICPPVIPAGRRTRYHSLPRWLAECRQRIDFVAEQIRLLYVACTRATDWLLLVGTARNSVAEKWNSLTPNLTPAQIIRAPNSMAWLGPLIPRLAGRSDWLKAKEGSGPWLRWIVHVGGLNEVPPSAPVEEPLPIEPEVVGSLRSRLAFRYPWPAATVEPGKTAVTRLTRAWRADEEVAVEPIARSESRPSSGVSSAQAIEHGLVHHLFCQLVDLNHTSTRKGLVAEAARLSREGWLSAPQVAALDFDGLWGFWGSAVAKSIRARAENVHRELPFTARLRPTDIALLRDAKAVTGFGPQDFQVIQGVVDLAVIGSEEIWIVDYKTDRLSADEVALRARDYRSQIDLYAHALGGIYGRPVTRVWLYFLTPRKMVPMAGLEPARPLPARGF